LIGSLFVVVHFLISLLWSSAGGVFSYSRASFPVVVASKAQLHRRFEIFHLATADYDAPTYVSSSSLKQQQPVMINRTTTTTTHDDDDDFVHIYFLR